MNIVFLDVDGELTYSDYENEKTANIDIEKVKLLKEICDRGNAKVVISSSWRGWKGYTPKMYTILIDILANNGIEVLGDTPHIKTEFEDDVPESIAITTLEDLPYLKVKHGTGRAAEVQKWINEHDVDNFVILDDEDFDWIDYGYDTHWVRPTWFGDGGLKREHVDKAIEILGGKITNEYRGHPSISTNEYRVRNLDLVINDVLNENMEDTNWLSHWDEWDEDLECVSKTDLTSEFNYEKPTEDEINTLFL